MDIIRSIEQEQIRDDRPEFGPGDTVRVHVKVVEAERERIQVFEGVVLRRKGSGLQETFTVRKLSGGVGVERVFPVHSPRVDRIEVVRRGSVRRAKLYYFRDRVGHAAASQGAPRLRKGRRLVRRGRAVGRDEGGTSGVYRSIAHRGGAGRADHRLRRAVVPRARQFHGAHAGGRPASVGGQNHVPHQAARARRDHRLSLSRRSEAQVHQAHSRDFPATSANRRPSAHLERAARPRALYQGADFDAFGPSRCPKATCSCWATTATTPTTAAFPTSVPCLWSSSSGSTRLAYWPPARMGVVRVPPVLASVDD